MDYKNQVKKAGHYLKSHVAVAIGISLIALLGVLSLVWLGSGHTRAVESDDYVLMTTSSFSSESDSISEGSTSTETTIMVDIKGAVTNEGVYELPINSRVTDAVKKAGGFTEQADKKSVNLAQKLSDEEVVYVAAVGEEISVIADSANQETSVTAPTTTDTKINLNTATEADLQTISGIGEKRAKDIISYREENGGFDSVDELTNVSGIGEKTLDKLKSEVTVD